MCIGGGGGVFSPILIVPLSAKPGVRPLSMLPLTGRMSEISVGVKRSSLPCMLGIRQKHGFKLDMRVA